MGEFKITFATKKKNSFCCGKKLDTFLQKNEVFFEFLQHDDKTVFVKL